MKHGKTRFLAVAALTTQMALAALFQPAALAAPETYEIDAAHSSVGFRIKHFFSYVTGRFDNVEGSLTIDPEKVEDAVVNVVIEAKSINTAVEKRDNHLRSADFFDVEKYPQLTFKSKSVKKTSEDAAEVVGDLTLHGVTKEVPLNVTFLGKGAGMNGAYLSGWKAEGKLKRSDFGMTWGALVEGTAAVGDEVDLIIDVEAVRKNGADAGAKADEKK